MVNQDEGFMRKKIINLAIITFVLFLSLQATGLAKEGDLNSDSFVNSADLQFLADKWLDTDCSLDSWCLGLDLDRSDRVDLPDFAIWADNWLGLTDPQELIEAQIESLISQMSLAEKVAQMGGDPSGFSTADNTRLGIPGFLMSDGPQGARWGSATCFPSSMAMAATWDAELVEQVGAAMGREFRGKGRYVGLAPCLNIIRDPRGGRSFETTGEDPYLSTIIAPAYIKGMQSEKVIACAKHFVANNQENGRFTNNVQVNERTLREIYLPAFKACVQEAQVWSVMSAYNRVNGDYSSASSHLLNGILKDEWGFKGFVVSDWGACHSTVKSANAGLDLEMPSASYFGQPLINAVNAGQVSMSTIDEAVRRILRTKFWAGVFDSPVYENPSLINTPQHQALCRESAAKSIVLLKNNNSLLPLDADGLTKIAVIGPNATIARPSGGGSGFVSPYYSVSPLEAIQSKVSAGVQVEYSLGASLDNSLYSVAASALKLIGGSAGEGLKGDYYNNMGLSGSPVLTRNDTTVDFDWGAGSPAPTVNADGFSVRWTGKIIPRKTGIHEIGVASDDGAKLWVNGTQLVDAWYDQGTTTNTGTINLVAGIAYNITFEYYENGQNATARLVWLEPDGENTMLADAVQLASTSDVAIVCVGTHAGFESEGYDRSDLDLPERQDELIQQVAAANPNTVVVLVNGSAILMNEWINDVDSIIECWFGGQESGGGIADVLFGDVNPGGKLPLTLPKSISQLAPFDNNYEAPGDGPGYRYYDRNGIIPEFVFGHGLSYTTFQYSNLSTSPAKIWNDGGAADISFDIQNTGSLAGDEVAQLYISALTSAVPRAVKELKGFEKLSLLPSEKKTVTLTLPAKDLAYYDISSSSFVVEGGSFGVKVGSSSADIRLNGSFDIISAEWSQMPVSSSANSIIMTAGTSDGIDTGKEFYFQCISGGGNNSGWQSSSTYEDAGLSTNTLYAYRVKARDMINHSNITTWSSEKSSTTADDVSPTPNPPIWAVAPNALGATVISMSAMPGEDVSGVEYYFACTGGGASNSQWQDSPEYIATGLNPNTTYSFQFIMRDKSSNQNSTFWSPVRSTNTLTDPAEDMLGHYKLDSSSGSTAVDDSGNGNHAAKFGNPVWQPAGGFVNGAIDLDGYGDYLRVNNESAFDITDVITVCAWIKVAAFNNDFASVVTKGDSSWRLARSSNKNTMEFSCTGISNNQYGYIEGGIPVNDNEWHFVAGVYDGSRIYLYVDDVEDVSEAATGNISTNNSNVLIGENQEATGRTFNGMIDDVRIYHRALPAGDMEIYRAFVISQKLC
jgi:beta-glucosidase